MPAVAGALVALVCAWTAFQHWPTPWGYAPQFVILGISLGIAALIARVAGLPALRAFSLAWLATLGAALALGALALLTLAGI